MPNESGIYCSTLEPEEKIRRIEELDSKSFAARLREEQISDAEKEELLRKRCVISPELENEAFGNIIKHNFRFPFLLFLFTNFKDVKSYSRQTEILKIRLFPPGIRLSREIKNALVDIQEEATKLLPIIIKILNSAWMLMEKKDYNLVYRFKCLLESFTFVQVSQLKMTERNLLNLFDNTIRNFLMCHYRPEYPEIIIGSIKNYLLESPAWAAKADTIAYQARRILNNEAGFSLYNIILALNIAHKNRYFTLKNLMNQEYTEVINTFDFNCGEEIRSRINLYVEERVKTFAYMVQTRKEADRVRNFIQRFVRKEGNDYDYRLLRGFYQKVCGKTGEYDRDSRNASLFAYRLFDQFIKHFGDFLMSKLRMEDWGDQRVFSKELFQKEFSRLAGAADEMSKVYFQFPDFPLRQFTKMKDESGITPKGGEMQVILQVEEFTAQILEIGKKLAKIHIRYSPSPLSGKVGEFQPLEPKDLNSGQIVIPFWNKVIQSKGILLNNTFEEGLTLTITLCFLIALYFRDREMVTLLKNDKSMGTKMTQKKEELERIADTVTYEKIKRILYR